MPGEVYAGRVTVPCPFCSTLNRVALDRVADRPRCGSCSRPILLDRPVPVGDENLEKVLRGSDVPVLVDFFADWCGPCKVMAPMLEEFAGERVGKVLVAKLNTDRNPVLAQRFRITGIPTLVLFREGAEVARKVGAASKAGLYQLVDGVAARTPSTG